MQLKDILSGEVSPFYSFRAAGGMNLWGVLFFFVASPLSLLVGLWDKEELLVFANLITVLKMMLCSLSALCYFRRRHPRLDETCGVLLAVCYAMSGYAMMYYQNSIWLDVMALFPLLYLSMERLQQPGGGSGYSLLLALTIVVNYYISYAVLLFLLFAAAVNCLVRLEPSARGKFALRLGGRTAFGLGLSAPVWLPSLLEVMASARTDNVFDSVAGGAMLTNFFTTLPLFYCTAVLFAALPSAVKRAFWPLRRLPDAPGDQRLRADLLLFVLMMLPVMLDPINKLWHTGSYQAFPVRYGFIPVLLGVSSFAAMLEPQVSKPWLCSIRKLFS
ncbi:MAG: YfhO family protein, partial [Oscillospiraceae bacterium]